MAGKKKALIVKGGWEGHEPDLVASRFKRINGVLSSIEDSEAFADLNAYGAAPYSSVVDRRKARPSFSEHQHGGRSAAWRATTANVRCRENVGGSL